MLREEGYLTQVSCTPDSIARQSLGLASMKPKEVLIDLASGASSMVARYLHEGVDAYAVDLIYDNDASEIERVAKAGLLYSVSMSTWFLQADMAKMGEQAISEFIASFKEEGNKRYRKGDLKRLPFWRNSAHVTTSLNGLTKVAEGGKQIIQMTKEAMRVTKPGGRIILAPFLDVETEEYWPDESHAELREWLEKEGHRFSVDENSVQSELPMFPVRRIVISRNG